jgi:hypothetical protein
MEKVQHENTVKKMFGSLTRIGGSQMVAVYTCNPSYLGG